MSAHIAINATILNLRRMTGLGVYAHHVLPGLIKLLSKAPGITQISILGDPEQTRYLSDACTGSVPLSVLPLSTTDPVKRLWSLNRAIIELRKKGKPLLFYSPNHHGVLESGILQVVTIHDLFAMLFPSNYRRQHYYFRFYVRRMLARTTAVIADSQSTAVDLKRFYAQVPPISVIPLALRKDLDPVQPRPIAELEGLPFFLFVGAAYPYKNGRRVIDAFIGLLKDNGDLSCMLVFAGGQIGYVNTLKRYLNSCHTRWKHKVLFLGYVEPDELAWLYGRAVGLLMTTLYEGFGLPALEAMGSGCPVIASNTGSLPEVCGDAALYVDPYRPEEMTRRMKQLLQSDETRTELIDLGKEQVRRYSWEKTAAAVFGCVSGVLQGAE